MHFQLFVWLGEGGEAGDDDGSSTSGKGGAAERMKDKT